jgi:hypothetical protein
VKRIPFENRKEIEYKEKRKTNQLQREEVVLICVRFLVYEEEEKIVERENRKSKIEIHVHWIDMSFPSLGLDYIRGYFYFFIKI